MVEELRQKLEAKTDPLRGGLAKIELFSDISSTDLYEIEKKCRWLQFEPNEVILDRHDPSREVFFIADGLVRIMNFIGEDREVTLAEMKTGHHFGELAAIGPRERTARVIAIEKTVVGSMPRDKFLAMLLEFPQISLQLLHELAYVISSMNERVSTLSLMKPRQRVYLELLRLAVPDPRGGNVWIIEPLPNHNDIASWAGVDEVEVAAAIGKLAREKILERKNRSLLIHEREKIQSLSGM